MRQRIKFTDERVCKSHLLDSCPHDILSGTVSIMFIHTDTHYHVSYICVYIYTVQSVVVGFRCTYIKVQMFPVLG